MVKRKKKKVRLYTKDEDTGTYSIFAGWGEP
jgi:hypothetical protein